MVGTVAAVGAAVRGVEPGQRVLCAGHHGDHFLVDLDAPEPKLRGVLLPIPDGLSFEEATFAILGDVALHAVRRARVQLDQSVAVFGLGTIGQLVCRLARLSGAYPVVGVDPLPGRRAFAERYGATHTFDPREDVYAALRALSGRPGAEAVFMVTANPQALADCLRAAADRGTVALVGSAPGTVELGLQDELLRRELSVLACYEAGLEGEPHPYWPWTRNRNRVAIWRLIERGELNVRPLISHVVAPEEAPVIYRLLAAGGEGWMSVLFRWS
jgi:threonine dehydrogenase-like Zn-dependent dehydrogenase